jgi:hypothetical protein
LISTSSPGWKPLARNVPNATWPARDHQRGRVVDAVRDGDREAGADRRVLRVGPAERQPGDPPADPPPGHVRAEADDGADDLAARRVGQVDPTPGQPDDGQGDAGQVDSHQQLVRARFGRCDVLDPQHLGPAVGMERDSTQAAHLLRLEFNTVELQRR